MDNLVVEIRATTRRSGPPRLVPLAEVSNHTGFRSAFAFPPETAEFIRAQESTGNLRGFPVYCDCVFVDFDNTDSTEFRTALDAMGLGYELYDSGGRSDHYHILCVPIEGSWVPTAVKQWVASLAPNADLSFYHPAGQFRLAGTFHHKNPGKYKRLVATKSGELLRLHEPQKRDNNLLIFEPQHPKEQFFEMLLRARGEGKRRPHLWLLSVCGFEAGMTFEEVLEHLRWWNAHMTQIPHDDNVLVRQCEYAYRKLQGSAGIE